MLADLLTTKYTSATHFGVVIAQGYISLHTPMCPNVSNRENCFFTIFLTEKTVLVLHAWDPFATKAICETPNIYVLMYSIANGLNRLIFTGVEDFRQKKRLRIGLLVHFATRRWLFTWTELCRVPTRAVTNKIYERAEPVGVYCMRRIILMRQSSIYKCSCNQTLSALITDIGHSSQLPFTRLVEMGFGRQSGPSFNAAPCLYIPVFWQCTLTVSTIGQCLHSAVSAEGGAHWPKPRWD